LPRNLDEKLVDIEQSYRWLKSGDIKGETESTIVATQDQAISTNYFKNKILKQEIGDSGSTVVKVLCYKSEGRWFGPSWCQWIFH